VHQAQRLQPFTAACSALVFMPLSSSVPGATRHARPSLADATTRGNDMRDSDARIADVDVRTGAAALSEVSFRLLFSGPHRARRVQISSLSPFAVQPHYTSVIEEGKPA